MSLKASLKGRPVIYEVVPPRKDASRFNTELRGVDDVLHDNRIAAVNVPELMNRKEGKGTVHYSPATIPPEDYAIMIKEYKEAIVNIVAPRMATDEFIARCRKILDGYGIPNLIVVGKERRQDPLPGPSVSEAVGLVRHVKSDAAIGGICIFGRESRANSDYGGTKEKLPEHRRVWLKAEAGCDFVTSQITFDPEPALDFLSSYQDLCGRTEKEPLTVFVSLTTIPTPSILSLLKRLDVVIPERVTKRLLGSADIGKESLRVAVEVFQRIVEGSEERRVTVPLGLQIEQVGINNDELSLNLLDDVYQTFR